MEWATSVFSSGGSAMKAVQLDGWDFSTIVVYFAIVLGIGLYSMIGVKTNTEEGYFLAGRFMTWLPVGASLFATNIGSEHYVGLSGSGAEAGLGVGAFELNAFFLIPVLGWVFAPVFIASGASTLPEYMTKRFGGQRIRMMLAVVSLVMYIFTKNSVDMYSGALFIKQAIGWNLYVSIALLLVMTVVSTLAGGLAAVIYTDTLQCFIMILGAVILLILGMIQVGGFEALTYKYHRAVSKTTMDQLMNGTTPMCGLPPKNAWTMLRQPLDEEMPWAGFIFGQTTSSLWYWCADQMMVQRLLAAKSLSHAQGGCLFCGYLKIIPFFAMVIPGMIARVLYPDEIACSTPADCMRICESEHSCSNLAYPKLVLGVMPSGLRGFMIAVMLSATMSDLSSTFNSASTIFTMDLYKHIRKSATLRELMIVGRTSVVFVVAVGVGLIPVIQMAQGNQIYTYIQAITNNFSPPIAAVYLVAILWKRANEQGTFWSLMVGFLMGVVRLVLSFVWPKPACGEPDDRPGILKNFHYMYYALLIFWIVVIVDVIVSLVSAPLPSEQLTRTTFWTRHDTIRDDDENTNAKRRETNSKVAENVTDTATDDTNEAKNEEEDTASKTSLGSRLCSFACGASDEVKEHEVHLSAEERMRMTDISQDPSARIWLFAGMVMLVTIGTFLLVFFSVEWKTDLMPMYFNYDY